MPKKSKGELPILVDLLEAVFSQYIRLRVTDDKGWAKCFTCDSEGLWTEMHNGHFMPRKERGSGFSEVGCQCQCPTCNTVRPNGNRKVFAQRLDGAYGPGTAEQVVLDSKKVMRYGRDWYQERISHYNELVRKMKKEKGL